MISFRPLSAPEHGSPRSAILGLSEIRSFLALSTVRGVGQKTLFALAEGSRSFSEVIEFGPDDEADSSGVRVRTEPPLSERRWSAIRSHALGQGDELAALLERLGVSLIFRDDPRFPDQLRDLVRPPRWLFVQGSIELLKQPSLAIVGTRKPSADGLFLARYVGACLGDWAAPTVSGLAAGIDQLAHEHSLRAGVPTIAVLGTGILDEYPRWRIDRDRVSSAHLLQRREFRAAQSPPGRAWARPHSGRMEPPKRNSAHRTICDAA
jgi:DNA processing protein